jgi:hypothetical protein
MKIAAVTCLAAIVLAPVAHAQEDRDAAFKAGLGARDNRNWQEVAAQMRRAIEANPREEPRKVTRGVGRIFGGGTEYLPYFFLGEALFNLQDCAGAVAAWAQSEQQGAVRARTESVAIIAKGYAVCEAKGVLPPGKFDPLVNRTRQHLTNVGNQAVAITTRAEAHLPIWRADQSLREQYEKARGELQSAQARLNAGSRTRAEKDFADATAAADRARTILTALAAQFDAAIVREESVGGVAAEVEKALQNAQERDRALDGKKPFMTPALVAARQSANETLGRARTQLSSGRSASNMAALNEALAIANDATSRFQHVHDEIAKIEKRLFEERLTDAIAKASEAFRFVDDQFATLDTRIKTKPADATPEKVAQHEALQKQFAALQRRRDAAVAKGNIAGVQQATQLATEVRTQIEAIISTFGPVTIIDRGVRPELAEGARLFFSGEYQQALVVLDPATLADVPLQLHVHLFRAASLYALYVRSGEKDQAQRTQAAAEIEKCKQLNPAFQPDARAFAPRFISFYTSPAS